MEKSRTGSLVIALGVLGVALVAWLAGLPDSDRVRHGAQRPTETQGSDGNTWQRVPPTEAREELSAPPAPSRSRGVRLRVVDAATSEPLSALEVVAFSERPQTHRLARVRTDARGEVVLADLREDLVILETERRPPHAPALAVVWLANGGEQRIELRVGHGGGMQGRVVDESGRPVAGATIEVRDRRSLLLGEQGADPSCESDLEGRFLLEALANTARGIWLIDGAPRPEVVDPASLTVSSGVRSMSAEVLVKDGGVVDVGDLVLPSASVISGHVVDEDERPLAGSLVSGNYGRAYAVSNPELDHDAQALAPGQDGFTLWPGETLTDAAGAFAIELGPERFFATVVTPAGLHQLFPLPPLAAGERRDDVVFTMPSQSELRLELVSASGDRVRPALTIWPPFSVTARLDGVRDRIAEVNEIQPGVVRATFRCRLRDVEQIMVRAPGFRPTTLEARGLDLAQVQRVVLTPIAHHALRLRFRASGEVPASRARESVLIHACLAPPAEQPALFLGCCGVGAEQVLELEHLAEECTLDVGADAPYWITLHGPFTGEPTFGPYVPGDDVHEIIVPPLAARTEVEAARPPAAGTPGTLVFTLVDQDSGRAFTADEAQLYAQRPNSRDACSPNARLGRDSALEASLPSGPWRVSLSARDSLRSVARDVTIESGSEVPLGTIALQSMPLVRGRVLEDDGSPCALGTDVRIGHRSAMPDLEGRFELRASVESPRTVVVTAHPPAAWGWSPMLSGKQVFEVTPDERGEIDLRLRPWRAVEITVTGIPDAIRESDHWVELWTDPPGKELWLNWSAHRLAALSGTSSGFRFLLTEGRYRVRGRGALFSLGDTPIEVTGDTGLQRFTVPVSMMR
jgi:hypothetical protein